MPSPRKGGTTPIRRGRKFRTGPRASPAAPAPAQLAPPTWRSPSRKWRPGRRLSVGSAESNSSWTDTTDTSLATTSTSSSPGSRSSCGDSSQSPSSSSTSSWLTVSSCSSSSSSDSSSEESSSGSGSDGDGSSGDSEEEEEDDGDGDDRRRRRARSRGERSSGSPSTQQDKRGRSWSRRGARQRGGSVLCRYCGRRGYGVMKMVLSCCHKTSSSSWSWSSGSEEAAGAGTPEGPRSPQDRLSAAPATAPPSTSPCPSPRYNWSPCSSDSSSSTLSEDGAVSSGDDADVEDVPRQLSRAHLPLVRHGGHVAVN